MADLLPTAVAVMLWLSVVAPNSAFIFGPGNSKESCPVLSPCSCVNGAIDCQNLNLTDLPDIVNASKAFTLSSLALNGNRLTSLNGTFFLDLNKTDVNQLTVFLYNNEISNISDGLFNGIENAITLVNLDSNNLTTIPRELGRLPKLNSLSIANNPLHHIDLQTIHYIGKSLHSLTVGASKFDHWPSEFRFLRSLQHLWIKGLSLDYLGPDAFNGFDHTLLTLRVEFSKLRTIPHAICSLKSVYSFQFNHNQIVNSRGVIFEPCLTPVNSLQYVYLSFNNLVTLPNIFSSFPKMLVLYANHNNIFYIDGSVIPANTSLTELYLDHNRLHDIPDALRKFTHLTKLNLRSNEIATIQKGSFGSMPSLTWLDLSDNILIFIADTALAGLPSLKSLNLGRTNLTHVPPAVGVLDSLQDLSFDNARTECSCSLDWMKGWRALPSVSIDGSCELSSESIQDYVSNSLTTCP